MEYDFSQFLKNSQEQCKNRDEFIERISHEIDLVVEIHSDKSLYPDRKAYLRRLEDASFTAEYDILKETDKYNEELIIFLESLS